MASINSLPLEVIDIIIRRTATTVDGAKFENQLALTARISSSWTSLSQQLLHSNIMLKNQEQARAWLESGKTGEFKTRVLQLKGDIDSETSRQVMEKMDGLNELWIQLDKDHSFDMNILQHERFSGLILLFVDCATTFDPTKPTPFPFTLSTLSLSSQVTDLPQLLSALLSKSRSSITSLSIVSASMQDLKPVLKLGECAELSNLSIDPRHIDHSIQSLTKLIWLNTMIRNEKAPMDHLEFILSALPSQLKCLTLALISEGYEILDEDLKWIEKLLTFPSLNLLQIVMIGYYGVELDRMKELVIEWKKRGIEATFTKLE